MLIFEIIIERNIGALKIKAFAMSSCRTFDMFIVLIDMNVPSVYWTYSNR